MLWTGGRRGWNGIGDRHTWPTLPKAKAEPPKAGGKTVQVRGHLQGQQPGGWPHQTPSQGWVDSWGLARPFQKGAYWQANIAAISHSLFSVQATAFPQEHHCTSLPLCIQNRKTKMMCRGHIVWEGEFFLTRKDPNTTRAIQLKNPQGDQLGS